MKNNQPSTSVRLAARLAVPLLFVGATVACSTKAEDLTDDELREQLVEVLTEDDTVTTAQANCVTDGLFENADRDQINRMANADAADEITDADQELLIDLVFGCL